MHTLDSLLSEVQDIAGNPDTPDWEVLHAQMVGIALLVSEAVKELKTIRKQGEGSYVVPRGNAA